MPGGPYGTVSPADGAIRATVQVRERLQSRCIHVDLAADGRLAVRTTKGAC